jgi:hypothetical protein
MEAIKKVFGVHLLPRASSTLTRFWDKIYPQLLSGRTGRSGRKIKQFVTF